jgi:hypothetical protein
MNWSDLEGFLAKAAPVLGTLVAGPAGAAVGGLIASALGVPATPEAVNQALTNDPEAQAKLAQIAADNKVALQNLQITAENNRLTADTQRITSVNATMQAEAANSDKMNWFQKGWRAFNGYVVGISSAIAVAGIIGLGYRALFLHDAGALNAIPAIALAITSILAIPGAAVGITVWHAGKALRASAEN